MAEEAEIEEDGPKKKSKKPLIIGLILALAGGGGGFYAVQSGMLFGSHEQAGDDSHNNADPYDPHATGGPTQEVAFVPMDPLIINLGGSAKNQYLRFRAQLEVTIGSEEHVTKMMPRVLDILNGYLRAVDVHDLENRNALIRLRSQMLRRIQLVIGQEQVRDLLIMEFVLN